MTPSRRMIVGLVVLGWFTTGVYVVGPDEQAVVQRCGRGLVAVAEPGAHVGLPWPFDRVTHLKPSEVKRVALTFSGSGEAVAGAGPQFITADRNMVSVRATVQYTIADLARYLWSTDRNEATLAALAESALAQQLISTPVDRVLTRDQRQLGDQAALQLQQQLDALQMGVVVRSLDVVTVEPPAEVAEAFERVTSALREREQAENQARGFADRTVALARATAEQTLHQAQSYRDRTIQAARGEAERFDKLRLLYDQSPSLVARRLYWEAMAEILPRLKPKLVIGSKTGLDIGIAREASP